MSSDPWPFDDEPDTGAITLRQILDSEQPVLSVFRDVSDRGWQFLSGDDEPDLDDGRIASLHTLLAIDPSLADIADLPIGWVAWRDKPDEPWQRGAHHPDDWDELVAESTEDLKELQADLEQAHAIQSFERFDLDQKTATLVFSDRGEPLLEADILVVGSTSKSSGSWLWAWDNPSIEEPARAGLENIAEYGRSVGLNKLSTAKWDGDEQDGWEMTAIAALLLGADGAYRVPLEDGALFLLLSEVQPVE